MRRPLRSCRKRIEGLQDRDRWKIRARDGGGFDGGDEEFCGQLNVKARPARRHEAQ